MHLSAVNGGHGSQFIPFREMLLEQNPVRFDGTCKRALTLGTSARHHGETISVSMSSERLGVDVNDGRSM